MLNEYRDVFSCECMEYSETVGKDADIWKTADVFVCVHEHLCIYVYEWAQNWFEVFMFQLYK